MLMWVFVIMSTKRLVSKSVVRLAGCCHINTWSKNFDERSLCRGGGSLVGISEMWHQTVRSIAVGCSSCAVLLLLRIEWFLLRLPMLFSELDDPQNGPYHEGSWPHLKHGFLGPCETAASHTASQCVRFASLLTSLLAYLSALPEYFILLLF